MNEENDNIKPIKKKWRGINVTARIFIVLTIVVVIFMCFIYLSMEFVMPYYYVQFRKSNTLTMENYIEKLEQEIEIWKAKPENEGADAQAIEEVKDAFKQKYEDEMQQPYRDTFTFLRVLMTLTLVFFVFGVYLYARSFAKPLQKLNRAAKEIAGLNFDYQIDVERSDEIGQLAGSIREMSAKLNAALTELKERNEQLQTELEYERELDVMRKKFVSDVSHELKTPLTVISGYAEALQMGIDDRARRNDYSAVIIEEADKMARLIGGLLTLSKYESAEYKLNLCDFDMGELLERIAFKYGDIFEKNGIKPILDIGAGTANADPDRIEQCVNNFLNNAVSHADEKKIILIKGEKAGGRYRVSVLNSGEHIDAADIENIWASFYRADKARKRDEGRFGIGLSIVRALLTRHGAPYGVRNVTNFAAKGTAVKSGVEFWFELTAE